MNHALTISGLSQITFAVLLGWPLFFIYYFDKKTVGPIKSGRRLLQCHIDNIMMGILQLCVSVAVPKVPKYAGTLLLLGSWLNPQGFLIQAIQPAMATQNPVLVRVSGALSFATLTIAYPALLYHYVKGK